MFVRPQSGGAVALLASFVGAMCIPPLPVCGLTQNPNSIKGLNITAIIVVKSARQLLIPRTSFGWQRQELMPRSRHVTTQPRDQPTKRRRDAETQSNRQAESRRAG